MRELQRAKDELKKNIEFEDDPISNIKSELNDIKEEVLQSGLGEDVDKESSN